MQRQDLLLLLPLVVVWFQYIANSNSSGSSSNEGASCYWQGMNSTTIAAALTVVVARVSCKEDESERCGSTETEMEAILVPFGRCS